jgi:hypothetical protein
MDKLGYQRYCEQPSFKLSQSEYIEIWHFPVFQLCPHIPISGTVISAMFHPWSKLFRGIGFQAEDIELWTKTEMSRKLRLKEQPILDETAVPSPLPEEAPSQSENPGHTH